MSIKIASWNVNSITIRLPNVIDIMNKYDIDILGVQETKVIDNNFPIDQLHKAGFSVLFNGQKGYNGTAYISKEYMHNPRHNLPMLQTDYQRRFLQAEFADLTLINCYVPNGKDIGDKKYFYKLKWLDALIAHLTTLVNSNKKIVLMGDFNITPDDRDVYNIDKWQDKILCSAPERQKLEQIKSLGFKDTFRLFNNKAEQFSWWDYRDGAFRHNKGMRIDLILTSKNLTSRCLQSSIETAPRSWDRPSDHAPVITTLKE